MLVHTKDSTPKFYGQNLRLVVFLHSHFELTIKLMPKINHFLDYFASFFVFLYQHGPKIFDFAPKSHKDTKYSL